MLHLNGNDRVGDWAPTIEEKEAFILEHKQFILDCVTSFKKDPSLDYSSDEFSIGLIAFNEAISTFNVVKGKSFQNYARLVINNRLIDYARKQRGNSNIVPLELVEHKLTEEESPGIRRIEIADEVNLLVKSLKKYKISMADLIKLSPREEPSRLRLIGIAKVIHKDTDLLGKLKQSKKLPINEILKLTEVSRSTLELNRKYIIALVLILDSQLETIKEYVNKGEGRADYGY